ncbi:MAG: methylated-DNA--[protein]-cysteine S-methyltransferase, partial [Bacteriovoracaceae bacterium]
MKLVQTKIKTTVGNLYLLASEKGLRGVNLESWSAETVSNLEGKTPEIKILKQAKKELEEY